MKGVMNSTLTKDAITYKYPFSDYLRVGAMAFVILLAIAAVKLIGLISRTNG